MNKALGYATAMEGSGTTVSNVEDFDKLGDRDLVGLYMLLHRLLTVVLQIYEIPAKDRLHPASYASRLMMLHRNVWSDQLLKHQSSSCSLPHQWASSGPVSLPAYVACTQPRAEFVDRHYYTMTSHCYTMAQSVQLRHDASVMSLSTSVQLSWTGLSDIRAAYPTVSLK